MAYSSPHATDRLVAPKGNLRGLQLTSVTDINDELHDITHRGICVANLLSMEKDVFAKSRLNLFASHEAPSLLLVEGFYGASEQTVGALFFADVPLGNDLNIARLWPLLPHVYLETDHQSGLCFDTLERGPHDKHVLVVELEGGVTGDVAPPLLLTKRFDGAIVCLLLWREADGDGRSTRRNWHADRFDNAKVRGLRPSARDGLDVGCLGTLDSLDHDKRHLLSRGGLSCHD
mmetsp:Transcript_61145/g.162460  ORF Transcript_61145/g.162460 Transcript_61145/m.162460 type:complete len:232 (+) Transcript_61145:223-918(+)